MNREQNDQFLHDLRETPRAQFTHALAIKLAEVPPDTGRSRRPALPRLTPRRALVAGGAVVVLAIAAIGVAMPFGGGGASVSAQTILERTTEATASTSYHLRGTGQRTGAGGPGDSAWSVETWSRPGDYFRSEETVMDASGRVVRQGGIVENPATRTKFSTEDGRTLYATFSKGPGSEVPPRETPETLASFLAQFSLKGCGQARRQGDSTMLNRPVYVIVVTYPNCPAGGESKPGAPPPPRQTTMWVDKETFVTLKSESTDSSGAVQAGFTVTTIEFNVTIPESVFTFTPPPGAVQMQGGSTPVQAPKPSPAPSATPRP